MFYTTPIMIAVNDNIYSSHSTSINGRMIMKFGDIIVTFIAIDDIVSDRGLHLF